MSSVYSNSFGTRYGQSAQPNHGLTTYVPIELHLVLPVLKSSSSLFSAAREYNVTARRAVIFSCWSQFACFFTVHRIDTCGYSCFWKFWLLSLFRFSYDKQLILKYFKLCAVWHLATEFFRLSTSTIVWKSTNFLCNCCSRRYPFYTSVELENRG